MAVYNIKNSRNSSNALNCNLIKALKNTAKVGAKK
jgi:hypothetical protein